MRKIIKDVDEGNKKLESKICNFNIKEIVLLVCALSTLVISLSVAYYFVVSLPKAKMEAIELEKQKQQLEINKIEEEKNKSEQAKDSLDFCLTAASISYSNSWKRDCEIHKQNMEKAQADCKNEQNKNYNNCKDTGLSEDWCKRHYLDERDANCNNKFVFRLEGDSCLLPNANAKLNNDYLKEEKEECFRQYELLR